MLLGCYHIGMLLGVGVGVRRLQVGVQKEASSERKFGTCPR